MRKQKLTKFWTLGLCFATLVAISTPHFAHANENDCSAQTGERQQEEEKRIDTQKARDLAKASKELEAKTKEYRAEFQSIYYVHSFDPKTCDYLGLESVNVVHRLKENGEYATNVVAHLDRQLSKVTGISEHKGSRNLQATETTTNWSGYSAYLGKNTPRTVLTYASSKWSIPTISSPDTEDVQCVSQDCTLSLWVGLHAAKGATDQRLAQAGTQSARSCNWTIDITPSGPSEVIKFKCTNKHLAWFEFLPDQAVACTSLSQSTGDSITAQISNLLDSKYAATDTIRASVTNNTTGKVCSASQVYSMTAYYASFIAEAPDVINTLSNSYAASVLPKFSDVTFKNPELGYYRVDASGSPYRASFDLYQVNNYASQGTAGVYTLQLKMNGTNQNILFGSIGTFGNFTQIYLTSKH